jgi:glucose/mannose-6-phosphate isomerase
VVVTSGGKLAELARADHVPVVPVAGGFQPRAAVAYMTVAALQVAALCGVGPGMNSELDVAADHLEELVIEWGPEGRPDGLAKSLARSLHGTVPVIAGAGLTTPIAYRWKTQANENAKMPAYALELPELDHNEIVGWSSAADFARFSAIFLDDCDTHPRVKERIDVTARLIAPGAAGVHRVESRGQNTAERVFSLVLLGDLVSVYLAALRGVDPEPVELLDRLKAELDGND